LALIAQSNSFSKAFAYLTSTVDSPNRAAASAFFASFATFLIASDKASSLIVKTISLSTDSVITYFAKVLSDLIASVIASFLS
jgi:hypothetical protein